VYLRPCEQSRVFVGVYAPTPADPSAEEMLYNGFASISGQTTPGYDHDGNTTVISPSRGFVYDAWNRIVKVTSGNHNVVYETLTFMPGDRASATDVCRGIQTDSYYSMDDQVIEDDAKPTGCGGSSSTSTYVWGADEDKGTFLYIARAGCAPRFHTSTRRG
jgi:hypothetical protein